MNSFPASLSEAEICDRLSAAKALPPTAPFPATAFPSKFFKEPSRPAAVLIPFLKIDKTWHILFTRRTDTLPEHSGQVAFPGGGSEPEDKSPEATALRETYEEIGLAPENVQILGKLNTLQTISNYCITPVVGVIPWPYLFQLELTEVSWIFTIPLAWLANPTHYEIRHRALPSPFPPIPVVYFQHYDGELLWGVSAQITLNLLVALELIVDKSMITNENPSSKIEEG